MPLFVASFKLTLPVPIAASAAPPTPIQASYTIDGGVVAVTGQIRPVLAGQQVSVLECEVTYDGVHLSMIGWDADATEGAQLCNAGSILPYTPGEAAKLVATMLYNLSGLTLQPNIYNRLPPLLDAASELIWKKPNGQRATGVCVSPYWFGLHDIRDPSTRNVEQSDWADTQALIDGKSPGASLWRLLLAEAHRDRAWDTRSATLRCATALDVALQPFIDALEKRTGAEGVKPLEMLRGERGSHTPNLEKLNITLFTDVKQLWYTRHGIIHKGSSGLFEKNPKRHPMPLRLLTGDDVERFLLVVVPVYEYVANNPP